MKRFIVAAAAVSVLSGCAYKGHIESVSGAAEVMPSVNGHYF